VSSITVCSAMDFTPTERPGHRKRSTDESSRFILVPRVCISSRKNAVRKAVTEWKATSWQIAAESCASDPPAEHSPLYSPPRLCFRTNPSHGTLSPRRKASQQQDDTHEEHGKWFKATRAQANKHMISPKNGVAKSRNVQQTHRPWTILRLKRCTLWRSPARDRWALEQRLEESHACWHCGTVKKSQCQLLLHRYVKIWDSSVIAAASGRRASLPSQLWHLRTHRCL
jgi:hypothetical protein